MMQSIGGLAELPENGIKPDENPPLHARRAGDGSIKRE
jgi:hypothetical protein